MNSIETCRLQSIIPEEHIKIFRSTFCKGHLDVYGTYYLDSGRYRVVKEPITDEVIAKHLQGKIPMGAFMLLNDTTSVAVLDVDREDKVLVSRLRGLGDPQGIAGYVERSKGKGYHVWFFFAEPVPARLARACLYAMLNAVGVADVEVFPKQDSLKPDEFGNFVNCPLFGQLVPKGRTVFVDEDFKPFPDQWSFLRTIKCVSRQVLESFVRSLDNTPAVANSTSHADERDIFPEKGNMTFGLLPCVSRMLREGVSQMQRVSAFRLAVSLKKAGIPLDATILLLAAWAKKNRPLDEKGIITPEEIEHQASCAYSKPYAGCGCNDVAVQSFCDPNCILKKRGQIVTPRIGN